MTGRDYGYAPTFPEHSEVCESKNPERNELPEAESIRRAQRGDASAFERLYRLHSRRVYAICLRMVANATEAEDLTQEAFLRVFRKIHTFRGSSAFSTWLHRIAINVVLMHLRRKGLPSSSFDEMTESSRQERGQSKEVGEQDISLMGFVDRVNLERALARLSWTCRTVFVLHDVEGFKHREIAGMIDCSVSASKGLLHRARLRLRDLLREKLGGLPQVLGAGDPSSQYARFC